MKTPRALSRPVPVAIVALAMSGAVSPAAAGAGADPQPERRGGEICRSFAHRAKVESDPFGTDVAYLHLRQRVCFDGLRITGVGRLVAFPRIPDAGTMSNWQWEGFTRRPFSRLKPASGRPAGSRVLYAAGQFSQRVYSYTSTAQVWVKIRVYGDGSARRLAQNA